MWTETLQLHKPQSTAPEHPHLSDYKIAQTCLSSWHLLTLAYFMVPGSWPGRKSSMLYPVKLQEKLNSPRSEENKPGQSQWVLAWIVMYLWHSHAGLLLLPLQVLQKHLSSISSLTTFQEFPCWALDVLGSSMQTSSRHSIVFHWSINLQVNFFFSFSFSSFLSRLSSLTRYVGFLISCSLESILQICLLCISVFRVTIHIFLPLNFVGQTWNSWISFVFTIHF